MTRIAVFCPGRGSYTEASLGSLPPDHELVQRAEELRRAHGLEPLLALDGARRFEPARHLRPANAAALIYVVSMLDGTRALAEAEAQKSAGPACIGGNSLGWYTALALAGALSFEDGFRLVQEMALLQERDVRGGQVIYPLVGDDWRPSAERAELVRAALAAAPGEAWPSIHLGGWAVLAGSDAGVARLLASLPAVRLGKTAYPFKLAQHGPYHTPLVAGVSAAARERLADLDFRAPRSTLIDGRGARSTPWSADAAALRAYTLGAQVVEPYDFGKGVAVALREHAPERIVLPGPGNSLGGVIGTCLVAHGWSGIDSRAAFDERQAGERALVHSMRR